MEDSVLEVCVDSVESAVTAAEAGADRLELCSALVVGGLTPGPCLFTEIRKRTQIPIHVLIRPRFGDFCYTEHECSVMTEEISMFRKLGAQGVVIGALTTEGGLHREQMKRMIDAADGMRVTLHRAFDMCANPLYTLKEAEQLGVSIILTSGGRQTAVEGKSLLLKLLKEKEDRTQILMGGGIDAAAVRLLAETTGNRFFHMSGKTVKESPMRYRNTQVSMGLPSLSEYEIWQADGNKIARAAAALRDYLR